MQDLPLNLTLTPQVFCGIHRVTWKKASETFLFEAGGMHAQVMKITVLRFYRRKSSRVNLQLHATGQSVTKLPHKHRGCLP